MPKEYEKIACTVGTIVKEALRDFKREPVPERFDDLLDTLEARECRAEHGREETPAPVKGSRR